MNNFDLFWENENYSTVTYNPETSSLEVRALDWLPHSPKPIIAGCGLTGRGGGSLRTTTGNYSIDTSGIIDLTEDRYEKRTFDCPECGYTNRRSYNELIKECQNISCRSRKVGGDGCPTTPPPVKEEA